MDRPIIIGTRGSDLALWQANFVKDQLNAAGQVVQIQIIKTKGDQIQNIGFDKMEGKGFFTKELEEALLNKEIDLAVHSCKDLETVQPEGLQIAVYAEQEDPRDMLLVRKEAAIHYKGWPLNKEARVGTSSARRKCQLLSHRPDLRISDLRGNVPTRVDKLVNAQYDAIVLASAGLNRLGLDLSSFLAYPFPPDEFIPAAAQGVLALQTRIEDQELTQTLQSIWPQNLEAPVFRERNLLNRFEGGCKVPLGVHLEKDMLRVSWAPGRDDIPKRMSIPASEIKDADLIAFFKKYKGGHAVFVSREESPGVLSSTLKAFNVRTEWSSLIDIKPLPQEGPMPKTEWVFFASANAVRATLPFLFRHEQYKFATIGLATAQELRDHGIEPSFIGHGGDTFASAERFAQTLQPSSVLLPQSSRSISKVATALQKHTEVIIKSVYTTDLKQLELSQANIYAFTSPSNVEAFFANNQAPQGSIAVAIGPSTAESLKNWPGAVIRSELPTEFAMADAIARGLYLLYLSERAI